MTVKILIDDSIDHVSVATYTIDGIGCLAIDEIVEINMEEQHEICDITTKKESKSTMGRTNFDKIKNISVDKMAEFLLEVSLHDKCDSKDCINRHNGCKNCFKEWLEMEVEE